VAYRLLGTVSEAEDVVQEGFLRLSRALDDGEQIESPEAYLVTVVTRLGVDELRSARARREVYVGDWLPEPILTAEGDDPARHLEIAESLSVGLLMVLETLTPEERAAFLLHEVFDYPHARIAEILGKSDAAARQLAVRARSRVGEREPRFETSRKQRERLVHHFVEAFEEGNLEALEGMLAADVTLRGDGGGKAPALARAIHGRSRVARTLRAFSRAIPRFGVGAVRELDVNGEPGIVAVDGDGRLVSVIAIEISRGQIQAVNSVANPDKLAHLGLVADLAARVADAGERGPLDAGPGRD
jgi:RNA polymerase sigma factor (sigma-70 family)